MQLRLLKVAAVQIGTLFFLVIVTFFVYGAIASNSGKSKAEAVCNSVAIGSGIDVATKVIEGTETEARLRSVSPDFLSIGFRGAFVERWYCNLRISDGRVVAYEIRLLD